MPIDILSDKKLDEIFSELNTPEKKTNYIKLIREIDDALCAETASSVLGIITGLLGRDISVGNTHQKEFIEHLDRIRHKLMEMLPENLKKHIVDTEISFVEEEIARKTNILDELKQIVLETLIIKSKHEIWNSLNVFFNKKNTGYSLQERPLRYLLKYVTEVNDEDKIRVFRESAYIAEIQDSNVIIEFFEKNPLYFDEFLLMVKYSNAAVYEKISDTLHSEKRYYRKGYINALPVVDFSKIKPYIKEFNWEVTADLIDRRPELTAEIIEAFKNEELDISKKFFMDAMVQQDYLFSRFMIDLTFEELLDLSNKSILFSKKCFDLISSEDQMLQFCKILSKKSEADCLAFLKEHEAHKNFESFLVTFLKITRLTAELKDYVIASYSDDSRFFYSLIPYMNVETIEVYLEKYYRKTKTVEYLLRRFYPQELIIEIHRFRDVKLAENLIADCIENSRFDDKDWILAMKSVDNIYSPIKTSTCYMILKRKPHLRTQAIHSLKKAINKTIWQSKESTDNFIKCLECIKEDCFFVFDSMTREEIVLVLRKSNELKSTVKKFIDEYPGTLPSNISFVRNCLRLL